MAEYIEREALHKSMSFNITDDPGCPLFVAATVHQTIDCEPAADVRPERYGHWVFGEFNGIGYPVWCSECGERTKNVGDPKWWASCPEHKYCGRCGAKMDGGEGSG